MDRAVHEQWPRVTYDAKHTCSPLARFDAFANTDASISLFDVVDSSRKKTPDEWIPIESPSAVRRR